MLHAPVQVLVPSSPSSFDKPTRRDGSLHHLAYILLVAFFLWRCYSMAEEFKGDFLLPFRGEKPLLAGSDFPAFYGGARLLFTDPGLAYHPLTQERAVLQARGLPDNPGEYSNWDQYYNPPAYSLLLGPLLLLPIRAAFAITLLLNAVGLVLLLRLIRRVLAGTPLLFHAFAAVLVTSEPVNYVFWHGQPVLFMAAVIGQLYLSVRSGETIRAGLCWAALVVKPHWLILPAISARITRRLAAVTTAALSALLLPFILLGPRGTIGYARLLLGRGGNDFEDHSFAEAVLSWSGFFRGLTRQPNIPASIVMIAITVALFAWVRRRNDPALVPLAAALLMLLVVPHSHPQDWVLIAPGAALLLQKQSSRFGMAVTGALLLVIYFGLQDWSNMRNREYVIYWPTLGAFGLLAWTAILSNSDVRNKAGSLFMEAPSPAGKPPRSISKA